MTLYHGHGGRINNTDPPIIRGVPDTADVIQHCRCHPTLPMPSRTPLESLETSPVPGTADTIYKNFQASGPSKLLETRPNFAIPKAYRTMPIPSRKSFKLLDINSVPDTTNEVKDTTTKTLRTHDVKRPGYLLSRQQPGSTHLSSTTSNTTPIQCRYDLKDIPSYGKGVLDNANGIQTNISSCYRSSPTSPSGIDHQKTIQRAIPAFSVRLWRSSTTGQRGSSRDIHGDIHENSMNLDRSHGSDSNERDRLVEFILGYAKRLSQLCFRDLMKCQIGQGSEM